MSDSLEVAQDAIEHAHHEPQGAVGSARVIAVLIAALAAALALAEMGEKSAQNAYLTEHISASDDWAFYQAKTIRANLYAVQADILDSLPTAADPAARIDAARAQVKRLDDDEKTLGRKQLTAQAQHAEQARDHAFHSYHLFEGVVGALQICIVLASVSVVTRVSALAVGAGVLGGVASAFGVAVAFGVM